MPLSLDEVTEILEKQRWQFAKTMPQWPHEYTLRKWWGDSEQFSEVVRFIRANGYEDPFQRKTYLAVDINGWKYWTMGWPVEETIIINRNNYTKGLSPYK